MASSGPFPPPLSITSPPAGAAKTEINVFRFDDSCQAPEVAEAIITADDLPRLTALLLLFRRSLAADTYPRQPGVDALHYVFRLGLSDASNEITGETTVTVKFLRDGVTDLDARS